MSNRDGIGPEYVRRRFGVASVTIGTTCPMRRQPSIGAAPMAPPNTLSCGISSRSWCRRRPVIGSAWVFTIAPPLRRVCATASGSWPS